MQVTAKSTNSVGRDQSGHCKSFTNIWNPIIASHDSYDTLKVYLLFLSFYLFWCCWRLISAPNSKTCPVANLLGGNGVEFSRFRPRFVINCWVPYNIKERRYQDLFNEVMKIIRVSIKIKYKEWPPKVAMDTLSIRLIVFRYKALSDIRSGDNKMRLSICSSLCLPASMACWNQSICCVVVCFNLK